MKSLFILFSMTVVAGGFSQENPWAPKGQNPWIGYETTGDTLSVDNVTADSLSLVFTEEPMVVFPKETSNLEEHEYDSLCAQIEADVERKYVSRKDFGFGFGMGALFGVFGVAADAIYSLPDSKQEKQIMNETIADSAYVSMTEKEIKKETKNSLKQKKFGKAVGGTLLAVAIRAAIFLGIIVTNF